MGKGKLPLVLGLVSLVSILLGHDIPLPPGWAAPAEPSPSSGGCVSCEIKSSTNKIEIPYIHDSGRVLFNIDLATVSVIDSLLFSIRLGTASHYSPAAVYRIVERKDGNSVVMLSGAQIPFPIALKDLNEEKVYSANSRQYSIYKKQDNIIFGGIDSDYVFAPDRNSEWKLAEIRSKNCAGRYLRCEYDENGLLTGVILPDGLRYEFEYQDTWPAVIKDPAGALTRITWEQKRIAAINTTLLPEHPFYSKDEALNVVRDIHVKYDHRGRIVSLNATNGDLFTAEYRAENTSAGKSDLTLFNSPGNLPKFRRQTMTANERKIATGYMMKSAESDADTFIVESEKNMKKVGSAFVLASESNKGIVSRFEYADNNRKKSAQVDALGRTTKYEYDKLNRITAEIYPDGSKNTYQYDEQGRVIEETPSNGITFRKTYQGNLLATIAHGDQVTTYQYDNAGRPIQTILPNRTRHFFSWDELYRLISHTRPDGVKTKYTYIGPFSVIIEKNIIANDDKEFYIKKFQYNSKGQLEKILYPDTSFEEFFYDCCNLIKSINRDGGIIQYIYDDAQRLVLEVSPNLEKRGFQYDIQGNLTKVTYPNGTALCFEYDINGRVKKQIDTQGVWTEFIHNDLGMVIAHKYPNGTIAHFTYDNKKRLTSITGDAQRNIQYTYGSRGFLVEERDYGLPPEAIPRKTNYEFDKRGRLSKKINYDGSENKFEYLPDGQLYYELENNKIVIYYTYDKAGRTVSVSRIPVEKFFSSTRAESQKDIIKQYKVEHWSYDNFGNYLEWQGENGVFKRFKYTPDGKLQSVLYPISETSAIKETHIHSFRGNGITETEVYSKVINLNMIQGNTSF